VTLGGGTACPRRGFVLRLEGGREIDDLVAGDPSRFQLLVLRPRFEGMQFAVWTSPEPVEMPSERAYASRGGLAHDAKNRTPEDIAEWIAGHPAPPATASEAVIVRWLVALLDQTNRCGSTLRDHPAIPALAAYVPRNLGLLLRALEALEMDHHTSERLLLDAIQAGLQSRQLPDIVGRLRDHPRLLGVVVGRDWAEKVTPDLVRFVRNGYLDRQMLEVLTSQGAACGLSPDEWLATFRLEWNTETYRHLSQLPELKPKLDAMIDERFAAHAPVFDDHSLDPLLELALMRGHPEAPASLQRAVRYMARLGPHNAHWQADRIGRHFDLSSYTGERHDEEALVAWFLSLDPAGFRPDPASGKYRHDG
jgi:hypothetical protein